MAIGSRIEWTQATWNPVTGCTKISPGCKHCYAETMAKRLQAMGQPNYRNGFAVTCHEQALALPLGWRKPRTVFVNSMSDLFHEDVPLGFIQSVFHVMRKACWHRFQVLTKRSTLLAELAEYIDIAPNVWLGVSVETAEQAHRIDDLRRVQAAVRFLSLEPLLGPTDKLDLRGIHWVIVGGESGPNARPMDPQWVASIRDQCVAANVPFFFKQWGGRKKKEAGRLLDGVAWDEMPGALRLTGT